MKSSIHLNIIAFLSLAALGAGVVFVSSEKNDYSTTITFNNVTLSAEVVDTPTLRTKGLSGRAGLETNKSMLFVFEKEGYYGFWMKDMFFPIDIFWIKNGRVVDLEENVPVPTSSQYYNKKLSVYIPDMPARFVLETRAGFAKKNNITIGDKVTISFANGIVIKAEDDFKEAQIIEKKEEYVKGSEYFIKNLRLMPLEGNNFKIEKLIVSNSAYKSYLISYTSDGLKISGVMNIPEETMPASGFPVLILNHGLIHQSVYYPGRGSRREKDFFSRNGYITIHPDYRGLGESDPNPEERHDFYVGYSRDVMNVLDAIKKSNLRFFDLNRIGMWGHSMGGGMAARVMVLRPEIKAYVLFAPISADAEENFYELPQRELDWLVKTYGTGTTTRELYKKMSPIVYFSDVLSPVQLHHGTVDLDVPIKFSEDMYNTLKSYKKKAEFFVYPGEPHEFIADWQLAANRALQFFDLYVKGAR